jgi:hypothetical protein
MRIFYKAKSLKKKFFDNQIVKRGPSLIKKKKKIINKFY